MLPSAHRLRRPADFQAVVRRGRRASAGSVVVHGLAAAQSPGQVGFVVSRAVGRAHARNLVKRRLRHAVREELPAIAGWQLVLRAKPAAADASWDELVADVRQCCEKVVKAR